jgi:hypothetical protein
MRTRKYQAQNDGRVTAASIISVAIFEFITNCWWILQEFGYVCRMWAGWWCCRDSGSRVSCVWASCHQQVYPSTRLSEPVDLQWKLWKPGTGWSVLTCGDPRKCLRYARAESRWSFVFCCPFFCCGNLGLRMLPEVGMSSTMFSVCRLCVPGLVCNPMSFHSIYLSMSILPRHCLSRFDIIRCIYTTSASFMSYLFEGVSIVPHLRSVSILTGWRGYVQKLLCWSRGMDEQVSTGPRSPEYILSRLQVFFLSAWYNSLTMESFMFSLQRAVWWSVI